MNWKLKKNLEDLLAQERGYYIYNGAGRNRMAFVYPNSYFVGMSNLGLHILYGIMNERPDIACERAFMPDKRVLPEYVRSNTPIMSVETQTPLDEFPLLAFAISYEMDYFNVVQLLQLGRIKVRAAERGEDEPFIIAGGPCVTFNPEPLSTIFDAFVIGEGEETLQHLMDVYLSNKKSGKKKSGILAELSKIPGVYVPSLYNHIEEHGRTIKITHDPAAPERVERQWVQDLDKYPAHTVVVTDKTEFNFYLIETARGCGRHCRFCMAGYCFRRPRNRSLSFIESEVREACKFGKRIGLMGAAISDYPEIDELCHSILGEGLSMSVASFRADSVTQELVDSLAKSGVKTLTIAPEAGSVKMRKVINKGIEEKHVFKALDCGLKAGIRNYRLYLMIGLPFEDDEDIDAIVDMADRFKDYMESHRCNGALTLSINPFIPKPFTPFQWMPMIDKKTAEARINHIRNALKHRKNIAIVTESLKEAYIQAVLARGGRSVGEAMIDASMNGGSSKFRRALKEMRVDTDAELYRMRSDAEVFPWSSLDMGLKEEYLWQELKKAEKLEKTISCFDGCHRCGVCK